MRHLITVLCLSFISASWAQTINGKIYDAETTVKGAKILNLSNGLNTRSDSEGNFIINAKVNDTLAFESLFHHPYKVAVKQEFFEDVYVFELKKVVNELDEVLLSEDLKPKKFKEEDYNRDLNRIIQEDIKRNPGAYTNLNAMPKYGVDFVYLIEQFSKLFKRKKTFEELDTNLDYDQIIKLFNTHKLVNQETAIEELGIPEEKIPLFIEYVEARGIKKSLIKPKASMDLLNLIVGYSEQFKILLEIEASQNETKKN
ncbi:hypothetical protein Q2T40_12405 [Winogradskyella maritima]|uniref:Carboxypeptidase-like protein n=1 Tax=Winogradskyella maritima TaxID=1517766 RepID=A0ABV8AI77_9FLAO|nr:hypothetical protein [Winogradskyella maritima]